MYIEAISMKHQYSFPNRTILQNKEGIFFFFLFLGKSIELRKLRIKEEKNLIVEELEKMILHFKDIDSFIQSAI